MPVNSNAKGLSALAGFGLLVTAIVLSYLNATTTIFIWSTIYVAALVAVSLAMASKFATALGVENGFARFADHVTSVVPLVALYFNGIQALHYQHDGVDGFMAGIAILALVFLGAFGVFDTIKTWLGHKYSDLSDVADETSRRFQAVADAASGRH